MQRVLDPNPSVGHTATDRDCAGCLPAAHLWSGQLQTYSSAWHYPSYSTSADTNQCTAPEASTRCVTPSNGSIGAYAAPHPDTDHMVVITTAEHVPRSTEAACGC
jgi:hypothetical protein